MADETDGVEEAFLDFEEQIVASGGQKLPAGPLRDGAFMVFKEGYARASRTASALALRIGPIIKEGHRASVPVRQDSFPPSASAEQEQSSTELPEDAE